MATPFLSPEEARRVLSELASASDEHRIILIGGQALSVWVALLLEGDDDDATGGIAPDIAASKDIDFVGDRHAVAKCAQILGGQPKFPSIEDATPHSGLVIFKDSEGRVRQIDFLDTALGIKKEDLVRTSQQVEIPPGSSGEPSFFFWVMHPERLMESRVAVVVDLKRTHGLALHQLAASVACAHKFSSSILDSDLPENEAVRSVLKLNERIFHFAQTRQAREAASSYGIEVFDAIHLDDRLPEAFHEKRYPQMKKELGLGER